MSLKEQMSNDIAGIIRKTTHPERNETWIELVSQHPSLFLGEQAADTDLPF